jgi:hypothetical protein
MNLLVTPVWGFGWAKGPDTIDPPAPFVLEVAQWRGAGIESYAGVARCTDHPLDGLAIILSVRSKNFDQLLVNVRAYRQKMIDSYSFDDLVKTSPWITGFAEISTID